MRSEQYSIVSQFFSEGELTAIAELHRQGISSGFLSQLGRGFLKRLYATITQSSAGILIAAKNPQGQIVGFVSGTTSLESIYRYLVRRYIVFLVLLLFKFVFLPKVLRRIFEDRKYSVKRHPEVNKISPELLSLVVDERFRGTGIAQGLFEELKKTFRQKGVDRFKIIVGVQLVPAQKFYAKAGAVKVAEIELHKGERSYVYECAV